MDLTKSYKNIDFPKTYEYSSDSEHIPFEFYNQVFPRSNKIDLFLGYFNSYTFSVLSESFAEFIYNGGTLRIITNHFYTQDDFDHLIKDEPPLYGDADKIIKDLKKFKEVLDKRGQLFFDCLKYLIKVNRLKLQPVFFGEQDMNHHKKMLFYNDDETILTQGSMNFTPAGFAKNGESFQVEVPWNGEVSQRRIKSQIEHFNKVFNKEHKGYTYLKQEALEKVINDLGNDKDLSDLLLDTIECSSNDEYTNRIKKIKEEQSERFESILNKIENEPRFPFPSGPRQYQKDALLAWIRNDKRGVFAMATGTGKTITSLNCLLNEYNESKKYNAIILVPSIALLNQWEKEVEQFNFKKTLKVGGGNNWEKDLANYASNVSWGIEKDLIIISTYGSFVTDRFQKYFQKVQDFFMLIADEAHNMGANNIRKVMQTVKVPKRIGLSATPKRIYDPEGTDAIDSFFNDAPPYTYSFTMERALKEESLTGYKYFPKIVELQEDELEKYIEISKKLLRYFDFDKGEFKKDPMVERYLLIRKNIIHKAQNKVNCFKSIISDLEKQKKLKYVFTYVPEGYVYNEEGDGERMLNHFMRAAIEIKPDLKINSYTAEDEDLKGILTGFSEGKIEMVFAMKMLDEGVDVPRAEVGIFCSSTGNPRQFIQRRGRLLRKHEDKAFATIYDMVVVPSLIANNTDTYRMERSQVKAELQRVAYFSSLSMNFYDTRDELQYLCSKYELNMDQIINEL